MNTFLPFSDFVRSAECLDRQRLGKQRVEVLQILNALNLREPTKGWVNHPCTNMWRGYPYALANYGLRVCEEWTRRGYQDTCHDKINALLRYADFYHEEMEGSDPPWWGFRDLHISHQSNLLRKDPHHYRPIFGDDIPDDIPYVWPTN